MEFSRIILVIAGVVALGAGAWLWLVAFAAGMSDSPQTAAEMAPSPFWLFALPLAGIGLLVWAALLH